MFVLTVVVFFHELGHFLVARWYGVRVLVFSIGFGPELFGFNDRYGTRWKVSAIPLGGYVKFFGDENAASVPDQAAIAAMSEAERKVSFVHQKVGPRAAIVVAGPVANFILAIVIFAAAAMIYGRQSTLPRVDTVQPNSAAAAAGFQPGDVVQSINGRAIRSFSDMQRIVSFSAGEQLAVVVERGGTQVTLKAVPALQEVKDNFGNTHRMGVLGITRSLAADEVRFERVGFVTAVGIGFTETWSLVEQTMTYIWRIFAGRASADQLGGPIMIAQMSGQVASVSFSLLVQFVAMISVSIGLAEPVSGPAARWRSPFVLFDRGGAGPSAVGTGAGIRIPDRNGAGFDADGIRDLQRYRATGVAVAEVCDCGMILARIVVYGQRFESKGRKRG